MADRSPRRPAKSIASIVTTLLAVLCLFGCGTSVRNLDSAKVERAITHSVLEQRDIHATVACPVKVPQQAGRVFTCIARLDVGAYPITVTETNGGGHVRYGDEKPLVELNIAKVQRAIATSVLSQRHLRARVACPPEVLQRAGIVFRCAAVVDGSARRYLFAVSEIDNAGHVRYQGT